ncbi:MAG: YfhO family protein, partial [Clostridia bacterium]|nr:YfhO family protein [Clostridia bacterium]
MLNSIINKIKNNKKNLLILLACFGVPLVAMMVIYACLRVWPTGQYSVLVLDLNAQYIYYFEQLRDVLTSGESLLYSFERALGGEFMGIFAYYLSSPFSIIVALFPKESITEAMHLILVLKTGCCGLAFGYYLTKTRPSLDGIYRVMFSLMYALSSWVVVMQNNVMWIDNVIAFPIILYAIDELIKHGKFKLYMVFLVYSVFSNFYIGYMMCIFIVFWFFARYFMLTPKERNPHCESLHFVKSLLRIILYSFVAVLICAIIILPVYYSLSFGKLEFTTPNYTAKQMFEFMDLVTKAFFGSYDTVRPAGMPFIYCGTLALILSPLYFFSDAISKRKKIAFGAVMLFLIVGFNFSIADLVWHGMQRPNWLNARFAFMFSGLMLIMSVDAFMALKKIGIKAAKLSAVLWCVLLLIFAKFDYDHLINSTVIWPSILIFFVISAILPSCVRTAKNPLGKKLFSLALCAFVLVEAIGNGVIMLYRLHEDVLYSTRSSYRTMVDKYTDAIATFKNDDSDEFYRAEKLVHRKKNDNFALDINGLSNSTSTLNAKAIALLKQFGYSSMSHWSLYSGNTPVTDALFG